MTGLKKHLRWHSLRRHYPDQVKGSGASDCAVSAGITQHPCLVCYNIA